MVNERDEVAEAYADYFLEHSTDFQADMAQMIESLWPTDLPAQGASE